MKGVSPLIAAVLLVAFVIGIAGLVSVFVGDFTEETNENVKTKGEKSIDCTFSGISFVKDDVDQGLPDSVNITARNSGQENLYDIEVVLEIDGVSHIYSPTENSKKTINDKWLSGETIIIETNITDNATGTIEYVTVSSSVCPGNARKRVEL